jgi:hypothetical protein
MDLNKNRWSDFSDQEVGVISTALIFAREEALKAGLISNSPDTVSVKLLTELHTELAERIV